MSDVAPLVSEPTAEEEERTTSYLDCDRRRLRGDRDGALRDLRAEVTAG